MKEECIICKAPLVYLEKDEMMECVLCHKKELSKTRCEQGHYVCNECHTKGMDVIIDICLSETSKNPIEIIRKMMEQPFCHMHGCKLRSNGMPVPLLRNGYSIFNGTKYR